MTAPVDAVSAGPLRVRPPGLWLSVASGLLGVGVCVLLAFGSEDDPTWIRTLFGVLVLLSGVAVVVSVFAGVTASEGGLTARLPSGRTHRLGWAEIYHFEMRGYRRGLGVWTTDGRWVRVLTYGSFETGAQSALVQLEQYRWLRQQQLGLA